MFFVFGLGNPGRKYVDTRHNVGFAVVDRLAYELDIKVKESRFKAFMGEGQLGGHKLFVVKPTTYMNLSGEAVRDILAYYRHEDYSRLIITYDDAALPLGRVRVRERGSSGGQNGMKSIIYQLETEDFIRVRVGIGAAKGELSNHVLSHFAKDELETARLGVRLATDAITDIITQGAAFAMNQYNPET